MPRESGPASGRTEPVARGPGRCEMMTQETSLAFVAGVRTEHRELMALLKDVRTAFEVGQRTGWPPVQGVTLVELLRTLQRHLAHHFEQEERGGYLEQALAFVPRYSMQAAELERQHPALLARVDELVEKATACLEGKARWTDFRTSLEVTVSQLQTHETDENQILAAAFNVELDD